MNFSQRITKSDLQFAVKKASDVYAQPFTLEAKSQGRWAMCHPNRGEVFPICSTRELYDRVWAFIKGMDYAPNQPADEAFVPETEEPIHGLETCLANPIKGELNAWSVTLIDHPEYEVRLEVEHGLIIDTITKFMDQEDEGWRGYEICMAIDDMTATDQDRITDAIEELKQDPRILALLD